MVGVGAGQADGLGREVGGEGLPGPGCARLQVECVRAGVEVERGVGVVAAAFVADGLSDGGEAEERDRVR